MIKTHSAFINYLSSPKKSKTMTENIFSPHSNAYMPWNQLDACLNLPSLVCPCFCHLMCSASIEDINTLCRLGINIKYLITKRDTLPAINVSSSPCRCHYHLPYQIFLSIKRHAILDIYLGLHSSSNIECNGWYMYQFLYNPIIRLLSTFLSYKNFQEGSHYC